MVKITIDNPTCSVQYSGDPILVAAELAAAIGGIYQGLKNSGNAFAAELFRMSMQHITESDSQIWNKEMDMTTIVTPTKKGGTPTDQS